MASKLGLLGEGLEGARLKRFKGEPDASSIDHRSFIEERETTFKEPRAAK